MDSFNNSFHLQTPRQNTQAKSSQKLPGLKNSGAQRSDFKADSINDVMKYIQHLSAVKELEQIRDQYYEQYLTNLETKVQIQRKSLAKQQERGKQAEQHKNKCKIRSFDKKLPFHQLKHDSKFVNTVTKSRYYHILSAENEMMKKGLFKTTRDKEDFWRRVSSDSHVWTSPVPSGIPPEVITNIIINRYSPNNKFMKQGNKEHHNVTFNNLGNKSRSRSELEKFGDKHHNDMLKKLTVKTKFPKLHAYDQLLLPPVLEEPISLTDTKRKERFLHSMKSKKEAFNLAMINHAMSRKMMEGHGFHERGDNDIVVRDISDQYRHKEAVRKLPLPRIKSHPNEDIQGKTEVFITEPVFGNDDVLIPDLEYKYTQSPNMNRKAKRKGKRHEYTQAERLTRDVGIQASAEGRITIKKEIELKKRSITGFPSPLNYTMMMESSKLPVKEAKCLSSLWVNYLDIGKT